MSGKRAYEINDVQGAADAHRVIDCPMNNAPNLLGLIADIQQDFGNSVEVRLEKAQDTMKITIVGQSPAVDDAASAVRVRINGGTPDLGGLDAGGSGHTGPGGCFSGPLSFHSVYSCTKYRQAVYQFLPCWLNTQGLFLVSMQVLPSLQYQSESLPTSHIAQRKQQAQS